MGKVRKTSGMRWYGRKKSQKVGKHAKKTVFWKSFNYIELEIGKERGLKGSKIFIQMSVFLNNLHAFTSNPPFFSWQPCLTVIETLIHPES